MEGRDISPARVWRNGPVGLVHRQYVFTPEDAFERLPLVGASGMVLVADARLNDRSALLSSLGLPTEWLSKPDGALILNAVERWGVETAVKRLCGVFAFALWDPRERILTLARDPSGLRNLYVYRSERMLAFSTRMRALLSLPEIPLDLEDRAMADYLILNLNRPERTLYRAIDRVPMGHLAVYATDAMHLSRFWFLPEPGTIRRASDAEYEEEAREILDRAVADASRSKGQLTTLLTGGLDSAAVASSAARQLAPENLLALTRIPGGALPHDTPHIYHDESPRARALAERYPNIGWHAVGDDNGDWGEHDPQRYFLESGLPSRAPLNIAWFFPVYRFMASRGSRIVLCGDMGNAFFSPGGLELLPELFFALRWGALARNLSELARAEKDGLRALRLFLGQLEPLWLRRRRLGARECHWSRHSALNPSFAAEQHLDETLDWSRYRMRLGGRHRSIMEMRRWIWEDESARDAWGVLRAMTGTDLRVPLADRRVVEFFGSLPLDQFLKNGGTRSLTRRLLAGYAPPETVSSTARGWQNGDWFSLVSARRPAMLAEMERLKASPLAGRVVDLNRLHSLLNDWPQDAASAEGKRREYLQMLDRGMEMGRFLAWHEGGNR